MAHTPRDPAAICRPPHPDRSSAALEWRSSIELKQARPTDGAARMTCWLLPNSTIYRTTYSVGLGMSYTCPFEGSVMRQSNACRSNRHDRVAINQVTNKTHINCVGRLLDDIRRIFGPISLTYSVNARFLIRLAVDFQAKRVTGGPNQSTTGARFSGPPDRHTSAA